MVGIFEGDEFGFFAVAFILPVLVCHFEGDLDGGRAAIGIEDFGKAGRGDFDEFSGEFDGACLAQTKEGGMGDYFELVADGFIDFADAVAMDVAPE